jgi:hypothetical protein
MSRTDFLQMHLLVGLNYKHKVYFLIDRIEHGVQSREIELLSNRNDGGVFLVVLPNHCHFSINF